MEMRSKGSSGKSRKRKKKLQKLQQESWDAGPRPSQLPLDIEQYYLNFVSSLFACLHPRSFKVNHQTDLLKGKPRKAFSAVYHSFLGLNLRHRNKNTQERGPSSAFEESDGSVSLELNCLKQRRLLKELDGTRSESAFEDLQNWCYFQRVANGSGRTQTYGWGNLKWSSDGTLIIVTRVQAYLYTNNQGRPCVKQFFDYITFKPPSAQVSSDSEQEEDFPGLKYLEGYYSHKFLKRLWRRLPEFHEDAGEYGMPF